MKLLIENHVYNKLFAYVDAVDGEISGLGKTKLGENQDEIILEDIILFDQTCSSSSTELDEDAMAKFLYELHKNPEEDPSAWNVWWHSHAKMGVFWSSTDDATIKANGDRGTNLVSIVVNKKREIKARLDLFLTDNSPYKINIKPLELEIKDIEILVDPNKKEWVDLQIKENEELIKAYEDEAKKLKEKNKELDDSLLEIVEEDIEKYKEEANIKVKEKIYNYKKYNNYKSGTLFDNDFWKKKGVSISQRKSHIAFEDYLDSILWGGIMMNEERDAPSYYRTDDSFYCDICGQLVSYCTCSFDKRTKKYLEQLDYCPYCGELKLDCICKAQRLDTSKQMFCTICGTLLKDDGSCPYFCEQNDNNLQKLLSQGETQSYG